MRSQRKARLVAFAVLSTFLLHSQTYAQQARYTWRLPKTVVDTTIIYTFEDCTGDNLKVSITPTMISRAVADPLVTRREIKFAQLQSIWKDKSISVQTFSGSHILNSIGSSPTSQVAQIGGNIFAGLAKLAGIFFGVSVPAGFRPDEPKPPTLVCGSGADSAQNIVKQIKDLKQAIAKYQIELSKGVDEATQKKNTAAIQAAQTLVSSLQDQLKLTIKTTIDPGISPVEVNPNNNIFEIPKEIIVQNSGLVATICPSVGQLKKAKWFDGASVDTFFANKKPVCSALSDLEVNVYLDFRHARGTMFGDKHKDPYTQTKVSDDIVYRDVAYIPVVVWRGKEPTPPKDPTFEEDGSSTGPLQLLVPQLIPFGQFGVPQVLPFDAGTFQSLTWQVTFLENGEITTASFSSKASGVNATSFLGSAVSAANQIATENRNATSASSAATALQNQADEIYQTRRLQICQTDPTNCPAH